ncbi:MAG: class I SAM-dependent methyltransferase [Pirellulales bacterium]
MAVTHAEEVARGERFAFGANWERFLETLDDERIAEAERALADMLGVDRLAGRRLLDIGSGSGLSSLAARRLGAKVHSFDYDPQCVGCTAELRRRYLPDDPDWCVEEGSVLDEDYLARLGKFDIVYSWGVLHQTGAMWQAIDHASRAVQNEGQLFISIYNDQGGKSRRWRTIKRVYNHSPRFIQWLMVVTVCAWWELRSFCIRLVRLENPLPFADWAQRKKRVACRCGTTWSTGSAATPSKSPGRTRSSTSSPSAGSRSRG